MESLKFGAIYVLSEIGISSLSNKNQLIILGILTIVFVILFYLGSLICCVHFIVTKIMNFFISTES